MQYNNIPGNNMPYNNPQNDNSMAAPLIAN